VFFAVNSGRRNLAAAETTIPASDLNSDGLNTITFYFPNLTSYGRKDQRLLGVGFAGLKFEPVRP
jgi:hypothetical protein